MGSRRKARELALQILFQNDLGGVPASEIYASFDDLKAAAAETRRYAIQLVDGTLGRRTEVDAMIVEQADNWRIERMPAVDRNLLRLAVYEMVIQGDSPAAVVIDEALEIAKRFSTPKSAQFVNGILDGIRRRVQEREPTGKDPE